jgi:hypothetical protein
MEYTYGRFVPGAFISLARVERLFVACRRYPFDFEHSHVLFLVQIPSHQEEGEVLVHCEFRVPLFRCDAELKHIETLRWNRGSFNPINLVQKMVSQTK